MSAKSVETGVDKIVEHLARKQSEQYDHQWRALRNRVDSILLQNNILKTNETRQCCLELDSMSHEQRIAHITAKWGPQYLAKVEPLLHQLVVLEGHILKKNAAEAKAEQ